MSVIETQSSQYADLCYALGRELHKRQLQIWNGVSGLPSEKEQKYRDRWISESRKDYNTFLKWLPSTARQCARTPDEPTALDLVKNVSKAVVRRTKSRKNVTPEQKEARLAVCRTNECGMCNVQKMRCMHKRCGCFLRIKSGWKSEDCPVGKWEKLK
jgi:hypothetical protein